MKDALPFPDSRVRGAVAQRNRLLEQHLKALATIHRRAMREQKDDLDTLVTTITRLATSITQAVRLHHQIWNGHLDPDTALAAVIQVTGPDELAMPQEETP